MGGLEWVDCAILPIRGTSSDVLGIISATSRRNTVKDRMSVMLSDTFTTPTSYGMKNPNMANEDSNIHGMIRL